MRVRADTHTITVTGHVRMHAVHPACALTAALLCEAASSGGVQRTHAPNMQYTEWGVTMARHSTVQLLVSTSTALSLSDLYGCYNRSHTVLLQACSSKN
jgi:hypothetical protein